MRAWRRRRRKQRECWHHETTAATGTAHSWIRSSLIEMGKGKMFWCEEALGGCGKVWFA